MASGRRLGVLVIALALVGAPAIALRAFCVGETCAQAENIAREVPFCSLPADLRTLIEAGYRQGRSPDVMATTDGTNVVTVVDDVPVAWPSTSAIDARIPIVFWGVGVSQLTLPDGTGLDQVAPTLAEILGFDRPHPQVRAGVAVEGVASSARPRLIVMIAWKGVGSAELRSTGAGRFLRRMVTAGAGTLDGTTDALPLDPAAALATIGTGALPSEHGIVAASVRNDRGQIRPAWGPGAPLPVVSTLAEDVDRRFGERPRIGLIGRAVMDRGLIGGAWYTEHDRDDVETGADAVTSLRRLVSSGFGADDVPDILGVALGGSASAMARTTRAIASELDRAGIAATFVVAATGSAADRTPDLSIAETVDGAIGAPVVAATVPGGLFLDQDALTANGVTSDDVVRAMDAMLVTDGSRTFADAYPGFAISFARYC